MMAIVGDGDASVSANDDELDISPRAPQAEGGNARLFYLRQTLRLTHDPFAFGVTEQELGGPPDEPYFFSYYVDPPALAPTGESAITWLRQSQHTLVFGPPGSGKTALRLTLEAACRSIFGGPKTLVVTYLLGDDFAAPLTPSEHWQRLAQALAVDLLIQVIEQFNPLIALPTEEQIATLRRQVAVAGRRIQQRLPILTTETQTGLEYFWPSLGRPAVRHVPFTPSLRDLLVNLQAVRIEPPPVGGLALLQEGLAAARTWGFEQIFVLIDEVDARQRDPAAMLALIQPLLNNLEDWGKTAFYFKFFLSDELHPLFESYATDAQTHLVSQTAQATIYWGEEDLTALLLRRFMAAGADLPSVDMLAGPGLTGRLTSSLAHAAKGSPRRVLTLVSALIDAHSQRSPDELLLDATDWEAMRRQLYLSYGWRIPPLSSSDPL